jgi:hypothetical protein
VSVVNTIIADVEKYGPQAAAGLALIAAIIGVGGEPAAVIAGVEAVLKTLSAGTSANADPAAIAADLAKLAPGLAADDAAADAEVGRRFPGTL